MEKIQKINFFIIIIYFSIIAGYFFGEDSIGGAYRDYNSHQHIAEKFNENFIFTFLNYDELGHRQSPIFFIFKSLIIDFGENFHRLFFLHLFLLIPYFFYKCLKLIYSKVDKYYLKIFSLILLLFPTIRSYSIWPDPHLLGTFFFIISIYFFLKFKYQEKNQFLNLLLNILFLALASYSSPNFSLFAVYFFYEYFLKFKLSFEILIIIIFNIILSAPFFYYILVLDINFMFNDVGWNIGENFYSLNNLSNKFIILLSIIFFYLFPIFLSGKLNFKYINLINKKLYLLLYILIFVMFAYFFDFEKAYNLTNSGGGFFYNLSQFIFKNNFLLYFISFITFIILITFFKYNKKNLIIILLLLLSNPQVTIWQANFSPTIFLIIFLILDIGIKNKHFDRKFILINYGYFLTYLITSLFKNIFL